MRLSEKARRHSRRSLASSEEFPFGPFRDTYAGQIHGRSVARPPFRTVSIHALGCKGPLLVLVPTVRCVCGRPR
jgi:hypothetical protein